MAQRRVTVTDVARRAGVSIATVSRVVNGSSRINPDTMARVRRAIEESGYRPTPAARNLRQRRTRTIALVVPSITNPFFPELVASVHAEVHGRGYSLLLADTEEGGTEAEAVRLINARMADGVLLVGSSADQKEAGDAVSDTPIVAFDRASRTLPTTVVQSENARGAEEVVSHLVRLGHRDIAHIAGPRGFGVSEERRQGYLAALTARDRTGEPALVVAGDFSEDSGYQAARTLLASNRGFTAIFAANDMMAIGAMAALRERRVDVPGEVAVAGFDGIHLGRYVNPTLTTYVQPVRKIAQRGVEVLFEAIKRNQQDGDPPATGGQQAIRIPGELLVRESSGGQRARSRRVGGE